MLETHCSAGGEGWQDAGRAAMAKVGVANYQATVCWAGVSFLGREARRVLVAWKR